MGKRKYADIEYEGRVYASAQDLADALGLNVKTVRGAIRNDRLATLGSGGPAKPVTFEGVTYPSAAALGRAKGIAGNTVCAAIRNGTLHRIGCGRPGVEPMRVRIGGVVYEDTRAAAKALRKKLSTVRDAVSKGDPDRLVRKNRGAYWRSRAVTFGPLTFPSMREASRQLGFQNPEFVRHVMRTGSKAGHRKIMVAVMRLQAEREAEAAKAKANAARAAERVAA